MTPNEWHTSNRCDSNSCVEVAGDPDGVLMRDTKDRDNGTLTFSPDSWAAFLAGIKNGEFDL